MGEILGRLCAWAAGVMGCGRILQDEAQGSGLDGRTVPETGTQEREWFWGQSIGALEF